MKSSNKSRDTREVRRYRDSLTGKYSGKKNGVAAFFEGILIIGVLIFVIFRFVIGVSTVSGHSMDPTLADGQHVLFFRLKPSYEVGDVVSFRMPSGDYYVKRVIAKEGDEVVVKGGKVSVNGKVLDEPYAAGKTEPQEEVVEYPYTVPEKCYFMIGDNREHSIDSRSFGAVVKYQIKGKILGDY